MVDCRGVMTVVVGDFRVVGQVTVSQEKKQIIIIFSEKCGSEMYPLLLLRTVPSLATVDWAVSKWFARIIWNWFSTSGILLLLLFTWIKIHSTQGHGNVEPTLLVTGQPKVTNGWPCE